MSGVYHGGNTLGLMSAAVGGAGRPIEAQCHPGHRVAVGDASASAPTGNPQKSAVSWGVGDGVVGDFDYGSPGGRGREPARSLVNRVRNRRLRSRGHTASPTLCTPAVSPGFPRVPCRLFGSRSQAQADPVEPPVTRLFLGSHRVPCGHFGSPLGDRTHPFRSPTPYYAMG